MNLFDLKFGTSADAEIVGGGLSWKLIRLH